MTDQEFEQACKELTFRSVSMEAFEQEIKNIMRADIEKYDIPKDTWWNLARGTVWNELVHHLRGMLSGYLLESEAKHRNDPAEALREIRTKIEEFGKQYKKR